MNGFFPWPSLSLLLPAIMSDWISVNSLYRAFMSLMIFDRLDSSLGYRWSKALGRGIAVIVTNIYIYVYLYTYIKMDPATNKIMQSSHCRPRSVPMLLNLSFQFVFQGIVLHAMYFWWLLVTGWSFASSALPIFLPMVWMYWGSKELKEQVWEMTGKFSLGQGAMEKLGNKGKRLRELSHVKFCS